MPFHLLWGLYSIQVALPPHDIFFKDCCNCLIECFLHVELVQTWEMIKRWEYFASNENSKKVQDIYFRNSERISTKQFASVKAIRLVCGDTIITNLSVALIILLLIDVLRINCFLCFKINKLTWPVFRQWTQKIIEYINAMVWCRGMLCVAPHEIAKKKWLSEAKGIVPDQ